MSSEPLDVAVRRDGPDAARVVLIGFMGAGKSTLARGWALHGSPNRWFDSDAAALRRLGLGSVTEVFDQLGEEAWREAERAVILERAALPLAGFEIWSLGGGAVADPDVQRVLFGSTVLWLDAPAEVLWERAQRGGDRPLAHDEEAFTALYEERTSLYDGLSALRVDASGSVVDITLPASAREAVPTDLLWSRLLVDRGALNRLDELPILTDRDIAVVVDEAVAELGDRVARGIEAAGGRVVHRSDVPAGEWAKQLISAEALWRSWSDSGLHRRALVIAVGGGTVLDMTGFAASAYGRGVDWLAIPTTLLSQVDAGIGGKTGVNLGVRKNIIGAIHEPELTIIDPDVLSSLAPEQIAEGMAEVVKTALLAGHDLLELLPDALPSGPDAPDTLGRLIGACARFKELVVAEDVEDLTGVRAQLNLGHTIAHAIEAATAGSYGHGRAVAVGLVVALQLSIIELGLDHMVLEHVRALLRAYGLPVHPPLPLDALTPQLKHDKKRDDLGVAWSLLQAVGEPVTGVRITEAQLRSAWQAIEGGEQARTAESTARKPTVHVLFGVNLGELGRRDADHYGSQTLAQLVADIEQWAHEYNLRAVCRQTDDLARFLEAVREAGRSGDALIINPGAWTHYERAIHDAVEPLDIPVIELHLSDVMQREEWRHHSVLAEVRSGLISGQGAEGYRRALQELAAELHL